jgi:NAD(P)H-dependent FMN reductase
MKTMQAVRIHTYGGPEVLKYEEAPLPKPGPGEAIVRMTSGALKNAIDFLYHEWVHKAAGFVGHGGASGTRAVENLRLVMGELQVTDVKAQVGLSFFTDFEDFSVLKPAPQQEKSVNAMLDQVIAWGGALKPLREKRV